MPTWVSAIIIAVSLLLIAWNLSRAKDARWRQDYLSVLRALRWWMLPGALLTLAVVIGLTQLLWQVPVLRIGWWSLAGGVGNVYLGQTSNEGIGWRLIALAVPLLLALILPIAAFAEESIFRSGLENQSWGARVGRQVAFGFLHCLLAGVPLAAGFAISIAGGYYAAVYLVAHRAEARASPEPTLVAPGPGERWQDWVRRADEAIDRSPNVQRRAIATAAAAHLTFNAIILTLVIVAAALAV
ncbi:hypothetical protein ACXYTP_03450 [Tsukamurella ocularis]|uniref:hypothetical protein n=1 Tax=Tsukamurella ocularis TaxID=1970234 RepID=UPI0039F10FBF